MSNVQLIGFCDLHVYCLSVKGYQDSRHSFWLASYELGYNNYMDKPCQKEGHGSGLKTILYLGLVPLPRSHFVMTNFIHFLANVSILCPRLSFLSPKTKRATSFWYWKFNKIISVIQSQACIVSFKTDYDIIFEMSCNVHL